MNKLRGAEVECLKMFSINNMKRIIFALAILGLVLPALPQARADVSIDFFYNNLSGGNWIEVEGYGYGWQPDVALSDPNWRPYADGYWAYTDVGWAWVSYEDFGWATYHYGRWANLADYGWTWFPGEDLEWGPAWVSWRTGGDYVGWAPLPPRGPGYVYGGGAIGGRVDIEFDIGPRYYNFIDVRFIGEPVLRDRIFPVSQNITYIDNTVNVTNITVQNNVVYNYGPDYNTLSSYSSRPIQRLNIERQPSADLSTAAKSGALTKVQGNKLVVAAPQKISKPATAVAPPKVKTKVAKPKIEKGWTGVANEAQVKEKIKTENPKNIPPPKGAAATGRAAGAASPGATAPAAVGSPMASPTATGAPAERGKGRGRPGERVQPGAGESPVASPTATGAPSERGRGRGRPGREVQPSPTGAPTGAESPTASPAATRAPSERGRGRGRAGATPEGVASPSGATSPAESPTAPGRGKGRGPRGEGISPTPPEQTGAATRVPETTQPPARQRGQFQRGTVSPSPEQPGGPSNEPQQGRQRGRGPSQTESPSAPPAGPYESQGGRGRGQGARGQQEASPATGTAPSEARGGKQKGQGAQPAGAPGGESPAAETRGQGKGGGKKKGEQASPTPGPQ